MPQSCGIVGLPNVGKSTIFNLLTHLNAKTSPYPFCTIKPNKGFAPLKDERLSVLSKIVGAKQTIFAEIEVIDCAGLVKGAHKGEGLGSEFLSYIRGCQVLLHVIRAFSDNRVSFTGEDPVSDFQVVNTELALKDLEVAERSVKKDARFKKILKYLNDEGGLYRIKDKEVEDAAKEYGLLTAKPQIVIVNTNGEDEEQFYALKKETEKIGAKFLSLSAKLEEELMDADAELKEAFNAGKKLNELLMLCKEKLNIITFFTMEHGVCQAWSAKEGICAKEAAGKVHSQMEKGFIAAEVFHFDDLLKAGSIEELKKQHKIFSCGKDYRVKDGDVIKFLFKA